MIITICLEKPEETASPLSISTALIQQKVLEDEELEELAEHLTVYCKHRKDERR